MAETMMHAQEKTRLSMLTKDRDGELFYTHIIGANCHVKMGEEFRSVYGESDNFLAWKTQPSAIVRIERFIGDGMRQSIEDIAVNISTRWCGSVTLHRA